MWLLWLTLLVGNNALSQGWLDQLRSSKTLSPAEQGTLKHVIALATCTEVTDDAAYALEQLRGERLRAKPERAQTIWPLLDALVVSGNAGAGDVLWPVAEEHWSDERDFVPAVAKQCKQRDVTLQAEHLATVRALAQATTNAARKVLYHHEAVLLARMNQPLSLVQVERLARVQDPALESDRTLLLCEADWARLSVLEGARSSADREVLSALALRYQSLVEKLPKQRDALLTRALQASVLSENLALIRALSSLEVGANVLPYFLAVHVLELAQRKEWNKVMAIVDARMSGFTHVEETVVEPINLSIFHSAALRASAELPFTRDTLVLFERLYSKGKLSRQILRLAGLAIAKGHYATARDALAWTMVHAKALTPQILTKLAVVGYLSGDRALLDKTLDTLGRAETKTLDTYAALLNASQSGLGKSDATDESFLAALRLYRKRFSRDEKAQAIEQAFLVTKQKGYRAPLAIDLSEDVMQRPEAPPVSFTYREPYALIPLP